MHEMPENYTQLAESIYAALARGDRQFVYELLDPSIEWNAAENFIYADRNPYIGIEAVRKGIFERLQEEWSQFLAIPQEILGAGDTVIARGRYKGTFKPTGVAIDAQFVNVFQFKDGKLIKVQTYTDTAQFRDAVNRVRHPNTVAAT